VYDSLSRSERERERGERERERERERDEAQLCGTDLTMTMHVSLPMSLEVMSYALVFRTSCYHCWEKTNSWCMINNDETMGKPQVFGLQTIFLTSSLLVCGEHSNGGRSVTIYQTIFIQRRPWCIALMTHLYMLVFLFCAKTTL
jgi:hypothetical protein